MVINAVIRRATFAAHKQVEELDQASLDELEKLYRQASAALEAQIAAHAGPDGNIALQELRSLVAQVEGRLAQLTGARDGLLDRTLKAAGDIGLKPYEGLIAPGTGVRISDEALAFVRAFVAADGLQLSDRLWRMDRGARDAVVNTIEQAIIQGHSAGQAARELLLRGQGVPDDVQAKLGAARAAGVSQAVQERMLADDANSALMNAERLMRTELNRAHGEAYMKGGEDLPGFAGWRYLLSPAHPAPDICDLLSSQNLYGLGKGVYPTREACPWPAHPNTLSFIVIVFQDEISQADRDGKETTMEALARLTPAQRVGVLGKQKAQAWRDGKLAKGMIRAPWRSVQLRTGRLKVVTPLARPPRPDIARSQQIPEALANLKRLAREVDLPRATVAQLKSIGAGIAAVLEPHGLQVGLLSWATRQPQYFGAYIHQRFGHLPGVNDRLVFQKTYVARNAAIERKAEANFRTQRAAEIERVGQMLADTERSQQSRLALETRLAEAKAMKRWGASMDAEDHLFVVAAHEAGHALYYTRYEIERAWLQQIEALHITALDVSAVSRYARTNPSELFAEVTAMIADGRRREVPEKILRAYDAAVAKVK